MLLVIMMMRPKNKMLQMITTIINNYVFDLYTGTSIAYGVATTKQYTLMHET